MEDEVAVWPLTPSQSPCQEFWRFKHKRFRGLLLLIFALAELTLGMPRSKPLAGGTHLALASPTTQYTTSLGVVLRQARDFTDIS